MYTDVTIPDYAYAFDCPIAEYIVMAIDTGDYDADVTQQTFDQWCDDAMTHGAMLRTMYPCVDTFLADVSPDQREPDGVDNDGIPTFVDSATGEIVPLEHIRMVYGMIPVPDGGTT